MKMRYLRPLVALCAFLCATLAALAAFAAERLGDLTGPSFLFVDDHVVAQKENVSRTYHAFEKYAKNPVMVPDKPWEGATIYLYGTVLPGEDGTGYRMWYHAWADGAYRMLYATSEDGLTWEKPELGLVDYNGSKQNNILFQHTRENHNPQVIHTPWERDPNRRYKLIYYEYGRTPPRFTVSGYYGMVSPDGIHWTEIEERPLLRDPGDVGNFVWDPLKERYLGWPKKFAEVRGFRRRCVGYSETNVFENWPESTLAFVPDEFDDRWVTAGSTKDAHTDFYGLCGFAYQSMYLGFLWMFPITDGKNDGPIFVELATSHDGLQWQREEEPRPPILALGPQGAWDDGMLFTPNHPLVEGDVIKLYYGGFDATHGVDANAAIGLATLRKDGFASLDAGEKEGVVTTKPLTNVASPLLVNYKAKSAQEPGTLRVELVDEAGNVIPGYSRDDCAPLTGDNAAETVRWNDAPGLPETDKPIRIRFILQNVSLYSFTAGDKVTVTD